MNDQWNNAERYMRYVGRWSHLVAADFLSWLHVPKHLEWLDVGCGTGTLSAEILRTQEPKKVIGIDPSEQYIEAARELIPHDRAYFHVGNATAIDLPARSMDVIVSGLVLNFIPDISMALEEFKRVGKHYATVATYVWDYVGKMEMIRYFWDAATSLFESAYQADEGLRFPVCDVASLKRLFTKAEYVNIEVTTIDVPTVFTSFDDFWNPFLSGQGPAPGFYMSLSEEERLLLKEKLYSMLPIEEDGSIHLIARAIAIKGNV